MIAVTAPPPLVTTAAPPVLFPWTGAPGSFTLGCRRAGMPSAPEALWREGYDLLRIAHAGGVGSAAARELPTSNVDEAPRWRRAAVQLSGVRQLG